MYRYTQKESGRGGARKKKKKIRTKSHVLSGFTYMDLHILNSLPKVYNTQTLIL